MEEESDRRGSEKTQEEKMTPIAAPWYKSPVLHSLIVILVTQTLLHFHIIGKFTTVDISTFADDALDAIGYIAVAVAGYARVKSSAAPVTLTQKTADVKNAETASLVQPGESK